MKPKLQPLKPEEERDPSFSHFFDTSHVGAHYYCMIPIMVGAEFDLIYREDAGDKSSACKLSAQHSSLGEDLNMRDNSQTTIVGITNKSFVNRLILTSEKLI